MWPSNLKHIEQVYIEIFVMCLAIVVQNCWFLWIFIIQDDKHDATDGNISMRVKSLEADLFKSVQMRMWESWTPKRNKHIDERSSKSLVYYKINLGHKLSAHVLIIKVILD